MDFIRGVFSTVWEGFIAELGWKLCRATLLRCSVGLAPLATLLPDHVWQQVHVVVLMIRDFLQ